MSRRPGRGRLVGATVEHPPAVASRIASGGETADPGGTMTTLTTVERDLRPLSEREAEAYVASTCFKTGPPGQVGVEIERVLHDVDDPRLPVPVARVRDALAGTALPGGGLVTIEPGGQVELSTACAPDLPHLLGSTRRDLRAIDHRLAAHGLRPSPTALDVLRPPVRTLQAPRYAAMERHFDRRGGSGRTMMCSTASLQVCLDAGTAGTGTGSAVDRWRRLHDLTPVLVALFANSPCADPSGVRWRSGRQRCWLGIEPGRAAAPEPTSDPAAAWARYALDASLLCLPGDGDRWDAPAGLTMRAWLRGHGPRPATLEDLDYHLTTLFPPIRPRGFLEFRALDTQAGEDWEVATAVVTALVEDPDASDLAAAACEPLAALDAPMLVAARDALAHTVVSRAALAVAECALRALSRLGVDPPTARRVEDFVARYPARRRCPADDRTGVSDDRCAATAGRPTPEEDA